MLKGINKAEREGEREKKRLECPPDFPNLVRSCSGLLSPLSVHVPMNEKTESSVVFLKAQSSGPEPPLYIQARSSPCLQHMSHPLVAIAIPPHVADSDGSGRDGR